MGAWLIERNTADEEGFRNEEIKSDFRQRRMRVKNDGVRRNTWKRIRRVSLKISS